MKNNARAELEAIVDMAMEWCNENKKDYLSVSVVDGNGSADVSVDDKDNKELSIFKQGGKQ